MKLGVNSRLFSTRGGSNPVHFRQKIHWNDMDAYQHMNNCRFFVYIESARINILSENDWLSQKDGNGPILSKVECQYKLPVVFPDTLNITTWCDPALVKPKALTLKHLIRSDNHGDKVVAVAQSECVSYNYKRNKVVPIPENVLSSLDWLNNSVDEETKDILKNSF